MEYRSRVIDADLADLVQGVPAVAVVGAKAIGKTESARRVAGSVLDLADPDRRAIVQASRASALELAARPVLIDEWQYDPPIWDAMRRAVDADPSPGRFILTGSANPSGTALHSGAGRVVRVKMRPMSITERGIAEPTVSLSSLWRGDAVIAGQTDVGLMDYTKEIIHSGFPGIRFGPERMRARLVASYVESVLEHDVPQLGFTPRRADSLNQWLRAYAAASSTTASYTAIADAVPDDQRASRATFNAYRDVLNQLWLLDAVPSFPLSRNRLSELGKMPKHQLVDPALVAALLPASVETLLDGTAGKEFTGFRDGPLLGRLFESLVTQSVRVYAQALGLEVSHIRTARGEQEIDLVVHDATGRAIAVEVKLSATPGAADLRHLDWLAGRLGEDLVDRVVINTGPQAYRHQSGAAVIPLALLGP